MADRGVATCNPQVVVVEKSCDKLVGVTNVDKWIIAVILGLVFALLAAPFTFRLTNALFSGFGVPTMDGNGVPTLFGIALHALVFILIVRLLMH